MRSISNGASQSNGRSNGQVPSAPSKQQPVQDGRALEEDEISLREIVAVIFKHKWLVLAVFALVFGVAVAYTVLKAPEYEASSTVLVNGQSAAPQLGQMLGMQAGSNSTANQVEILRSRTIARRVAAKLMKRGDTGGNAGSNAGSDTTGAEKKLSILKTPEGQPLTRRTVAERLLGPYMRVAPVAEAVDVVEMTSTSTVAREAALIANLYAEEYTAYDRASSSRRARKSRKFLSEAIENFQSNLRQQEQELMQFYEKQQVVAPEEEAKQLLQQVTELNQLQYQAQIKRAKARVRQRRLRSRLDSIQPGLADEITENDKMQYQALQKSVTSLQAELAGLYAANPSLRADAIENERVEEIKQKIAGLREQVRARAEDLSRDALSGSGTGVTGNGKLARVQSLSNELLQNQLSVKAAQTSLGIVKEQLGAYRSRLDDIPQKDIILSRLERSLKTNSSVYANLRKQLYDARLAENSEIGKVEVVDNAVVPKNPVRPRVPLVLALGIVMGLMMGVGVAFFRNALDDRVHTPEDVEELGQSVLGTVPDMQPVVESDFQGRERIDVEGRKYDVRLITLLNPLSPISESYRQLRTNLRFSQPDRTARTVVVTSAGPGEGKSVTAANLAVSMAQTGKRTLFLDADLRRPGGYRMFDRPSEPGLVELLFDSVSVGLDQFSTEVENLHVVPIGSSVPNPAEVVGSERMGGLLEQVHREFDAVVIDTPPVLAVTDPLLVSEHADATMLVCSANQTTQPALDRAADTLQNAGANLVGVLLNRFDPQAAYGSYGYGGGYGYGEGYGYESGAGVAERRPEGRMSRPA